MANSGWRYGTVDTAADHEWVGNAHTLSKDSTIPENFSVVLYGPDAVIKIAAGTSIRIGNNSVVKIKDINTV